MHVGMAIIFQNPGARARTATSTRTSSGSPISPSRSASSRSGASSTTSPTTRCAPTCCSSSPTSPARTAARPARLDGGGAAVARPDARRRAGRRCSTTCRTAASILGIGRGARRVEFEGFRRRHGRVARALRRDGRDDPRRASRRGYCEYDGKFVKQPRARRSGRGRSSRSAAAPTRRRCRPSRRRIMAELGVGILIIPQKPWGMVAKELDDYRAIYREVNGTEAPPPIVRRLDVLRRERRPRRGDGAAVHRRLLADGRCATTSFAATTSASTKGYEYYGRCRRRSRRAASTR